jgi:Cysteine-rich secretory protein family
VQTAKAAVPPLAWNAKLEQAADMHNRDMASNNYFAHTSPSGKTPADRINATGYAWRAYGDEPAESRGARQQENSGDMTPFMILFPQDELIPAKDT